MVVSRQDRKMSHPGNSSSMSRPQNERSRVTKGEGSLLRWLVTTPYLDEWGEWASEAGERVDDNDNDNANDGNDSDDEKWAVARTRRRGGGGIGFVDSRWALRIATSHVRLSGVVISLYLLWGGGSAGTQERWLGLS